MTVALQYIPALPPTWADAERITSERSKGYAGNLLKGPKFLACHKEFAKRGWTVTFHVIGLLKAKTDLVWIELLETIIIIGTKSLDLGARSKFQSDAVADLIQGIQHQTPGMLSHGDVQLNKCLSIKSRLLGPPDNVFCGMCKTTNNCQWRSAAPGGLYGDYVCNACHQVLSSNRANPLSLEQGLQRRHALELPLKSCCESCGGMAMVSVS